MEIFDGCCLISGFASIKDKILEMDVRDSDIWLCAFPKSGTTWSQEIVWLLANDLDFGRSLSIPLLERFPLVERTMIEIYFGEITKKFNAGTCSVQVAMDMPGRRLIKTHLPWQLLPRQIQNGEKKPKIIWVTRNPKDALVSAYHHFTNCQLEDQTFNVFFENFLNDKGLYCPFWQHTWDYLDHVEEHNIFRLQYEDMKSDLQTEIRRISKFIDIDPPDKDGMNKLLDHVKFDAMQANKMVNMDIVFNVLKKAEICNEDFKFIRKGKIGEYREKLTPEMEGRMDIWIQDHLSKRGMSSKDCPVKII